VASLTARPDRAWVAQQARNVARHFAEQGHAPTHMPLDYDGKVGPDFDAIFEADGVAVKRLGPVAPNLNA
jgi:hypothetical protein